MENFQLDCISQVFKKEWKTACLGSLLSVVLASIIISGFGWPNFEFPYCYAAGYEGDSFFSLAVIQGFIDGGIFEIARSGYPFGSSLADFPCWDSVPKLIFVFLSKFSNTSFQILNAFILISFVFNFISCFFVLRSFKINTSLAFLASLLFNFLPYHFMRFHHITYLLYVSIPVYFYTSLKLYAYVDEEDWQSWCNENKLLFSLIVLSAFSGAYYAFFGVIIILTAGISASLSKVSYKPLQRSACYILLILATVLVNMLPSLINNVNKGKNQEIAIRSFAESENNGLKLSQLVLPNIAHRIEGFQKVSSEYHTKVPLINEYAVSLGVFGSLGFLSLIGLIFFMQTGRKLDSRLLILSILTFTMFLTATVAGFSVLFSMLVTPLIRGWCRISIFIGFASITAMCILMEMYFKDRLSPKLLNLCCVAVGLIGFLDQTPSEKFMSEHQNKIKQKFTADQKFIQSIEAIVPPGSPIFQYPYIIFPEGGTYEPMIGLIHSKSLRWNFGAVRGREGDAFYRALDKESLNKQLDVIKKLGFQGIYIDKGFYKDGGQEIVQKYSLLLGKNPDVASDDGRIVFFKLKDVPQFKLDHLPYSEIMKRADYYPGIKNDATNQALLREMMYGVLR
jgi:phosphoglycerol transferase